jgi:protein gp37
MQSGGTVVGRSNPNCNGRIIYDRAAMHLPCSWATPQRISVNPVPDLFHEDVELEGLRQVFDVMNNCPQHRFEFVTNRSQIMRAVAPRLTWTPNISAGVSIDNAGSKSRIDDLRATPASDKWISAEPLAGPLDGLDLSGIDRVVAAGRPCPGPWCSSGG